MAESRKSKTHGRRQCDLGIHRWLRDWSFLAAVLAFGAIGGGIEYQVLASEDSLKSAKIERDIIKELQRLQAETNGRVEEALETVKKQNSMMLQILLSRNGGKPTNIKPGIRQ